MDESNKNIISWHGACGKQADSTICSTRVCVASGWTHAFGNSKEKIQTKTMNSPFFDIKPQAKHLKKKKWRLLWYSVQLNSIGGTQNCPHFSDATMECSNQKPKQKPNRIQSKRDEEKGEILINDKIFIICICAWGWARACECVRACMCVCMCE